MANRTSRLGFVQPEGGENVDIGMINNNFDIADDHPGYFICTSTTRPNAPFNGQHIYETDTGRSWVYYESRWMQIGWPEKEASASDLQLSGGSYRLWLSINRTGPKTAVFSGRIQRTHSADTTLSATTTGAFVSFGLNPQNIAAFNGEHAWAKPTGAMSPGTSAAVFFGILSGSGKSDVIQLSMSSTELGVRVTSSVTWPGGGTVFASFEGVNMKIAGS